MSPAFATELAIRLWCFRFWAIGVSILGLVVVAAAMFFGPPIAAQLAGVISGPAIGFPWAVLCLVSWFHPTKGTMSPSARIMGRLPNWLQNGVRWYAVIFLLVFAFVCLLAWPAFAISSLW